MILGWEDIAGGSIILSILIWLGLSSLFYIVCYLAVLNIIDDVTKNHWAKAPLCAVAALPFGFLIAIFNYSPWIICLLMAFSNLHRVKGLADPQNKKFKDIKLNLPLFYTSSYAYIILLCALAYLFQMPTEFGGLTETVPWWKTLFPEFSEFPE